MNAGVLNGVRVTHESAGVDEIEAVCTGSEGEAVETLLEREGVTEAVVLQTCNRAEAYVVADTVNAGREALSAYVGDVEATATVRSGHEESLEHLLRVACGLESIVLGEDQVLGQLRGAYEAAREVDGVGVVLEDALLKAIHVGERARSETAINEGIVSLGSAAVSLVSREGTLSETTALVVGAGEMGRLAARAFAARGVDRLLVANRTISHAEHVASEVDVAAEGIGLDALSRATEEADAVVTATGGPEPILDGETIGNGPLVVVDLAQPRDVDPSVGEREDVTVYDLDSLQAITESTRAERAAAAEEVEAMVEAELDRLLRGFKAKRADEAIGAMYENAERMKRRELSTAIAALEAHGELTEKQREAVCALASALVNQLLAAPTSSLREAAAEDDWTTIHTALELFDPEFEEAPPLGSGENREHLQGTTDDRPDRAAARLYDDD
ncbi:glutamyl-tRNA reductase [Natronorarus salvus]|uniref:glutamyl-tRNA reductase n=1 Tax=Natronorarus salvus TaxID=3117733 RepID=UPI002F262BF4